MLKVIDSAVPVACWSCSVAHNASTLFCPHCSKIQPPPAAIISPSSDWSRGSISIWAAGTRVSPAQPQAASRPLCARQRKRERVEPGRYRAAQRRLSHAAKTRCTAPNICSSCTAPRSAKSTRQGSQRPGPSRVPADLLEEVFELNMQLEEMRMAHKMGEDEDPELQAEPRRRRRRNSKACSRMWTATCARNGQRGTKAMTPRAQARRRSHGGAARPPPLSQQPGPRCDRDSGSLERQ